MDAFIVNLGSAAVLLRNTTAGAGHWVGVRLVGKKSNRDGIGAKIEVVAGGVRQQRERIAGSGYLSQDDGACISGWEGGDHREADRHLAQRRGADARQRAGGPRDRHRREIACDCPSEAEDRRVDRRKRLSHMYHSTLKPLWAGPRPAADPLVGLLEHTKSRTKGVRRGRGRPPHCSWQALRRQLLMLCATAAALAYPSPIEIAVSANGSRLYVVCEGTDEVVEVDAAAGTVVRRVGVGQHPKSVALSSDGRQLYVANSWSDTVSVIDAASLKVVQELAGGVRAQRGRGRSGGPLSLCRQPHRQRYLGDRPGARRGDQALAGRARRRVPGALRGWAAHVLHAHLPAAGAVPVAARIGGDGDRHAPSGSGGARKATQRRGRFPRGSPRTAAGWRLRPRCGPRT